MNKEELVLLIKKAQNGDRDAFEKIYEETGKSVYFNCLKLTHNEQAARDILQSAYLKAMDCPEGTVENVWMSSDIMTVKMDMGYYTASIGWGDEDVDSAFYPCDALNNVADRIVRITNSGNVLLSNGYLYDYTID